MLEVHNIRIRGFSLKHLDLYWEIVPTTEDAHLYSMQVLRSEAPEGPYAAVCPAFYDTFHYRDGSVDLRKPFRRWYYRIRVTDPDGESLDYPSIGGAALEARPSLEALEASRRVRRVLRHRAGRRLIFYPPRTFGQLCSCVDPITQQKLDDDHLTCFGTGWVGGYHRPFFEYGAISHTDKFGASALERDVQAQTAWLFVGNFPFVQSDWVVIENENIRWRAGAVASVERYRYPVLQRVKLSRIAVGDIEYELPIEIADPSVVDATPPSEFRNQRIVP
jgi:hypothetical protein